MAMEPGDYRAETNSSNNPTATLMREALREYVDTSPSETHRAQFQKEVDQQMKIEARLLGKKGLSEGDIEHSLRERRGQVEARIIRDREGYSTMTSSSEPVIQRPRTDAEQQNFVRGQYEAAKTEYEKQLLELIADQNGGRNASTRIAKDKMHAAKREAGPLTLAELEVDTQRRQAEIDAQLAALRNPQITTNIVRTPVTVDNATLRAQERLRQTGAHIPAPHLARQETQPAPPQVVEQTPEEVVDDYSFEQRAQDVKALEKLVTVQRQPLSAIEQLREERRRMIPFLSSPEVARVAVDIDNRIADLQKETEQTTSFHDLLDQTRGIVNAIQKEKNSSTPNYVKIIDDARELNKLVRENKIVFPELPFDIPWAELTDAYLWDLRLANEENINGLGGILSALSRLSESQGNSQENIEHYLKELEYHLNAQGYYGVDRQLVENLRTQFPQLKKHFENNTGQHSVSDFDLNDENQKLQELVEKSNTNYEPEIVIVLDKSQLDLSRALNKFESSTRRYKKDERYRQQIRNETPQKVYNDALSLVSNQLDIVENHLDQNMDMDAVRRLMLVNYIQKEKALLALYRSVTDTTLVDQNLFRNDWEKLNSEVLQIKKELGGYDQEQMPEVVVTTEEIADPNREYHPIDIYRILDADSKDLAFLVVSRYFNSPMDVNELQEKILKAQETINRLYSDNKEERFNVRVSGTEADQMQLVKKYAELERALIAHAQKALTSVTDPSVSEQNRREFNETLAQMYKVKDTITPRGRNSKATASATP